MPGPDDVYLLQSKSCSTGAASRFLLLPALPAAVVELAGAVFVFVVVDVDAGVFNVYAAGAAGTMAGSGFAATTVYFLWSHHAGVFTLCCTTLVNPTGQFGDLSPTGTQIRSVCSYSINA